MKKVIIILLIILLSIPQTVLAADALYRMLHADEVEEFANDQDAVIVCQILDETKTFFNVQVIHVLSGETDSDNILLENDFSYIGFEIDVKPAIEDYCVISIKKYDDHYKKVWYAMRTDTGIYETLKILYDKYYSDISALQWYINSGGKDKDFFFDGNQVFVKKEDGSSLNITVPNNINDSEETDTGQSDAAVVDTGEDGNSIVLLIVIAAISLLGVASLIMINRKNNSE